MNLPQRQPLEILRVVPRRIESGLSILRARHVAAIKEQLTGDFDWVRFEEAGVVRRVKQIPGRRAVVRNDFGHDGATKGGLVWVFSQSDVSVIALVKGGSMGGFLV